MSIQDLQMRPDAPLTDEQIKRLADLGLDIVGRLPDGAYRLRGESAATAADLITLDFLDTAVPFDPGEKLDPTLAAVVGSPSIAGDGDDAVVTALASID